jgi:nucleoside-diphosphate-sugar epimerase
VMDLAALSNDPSGDLDPSMTFDINYLGRSRVARLSKEYGVKRYILASSCSVYGFQDQILDETSNVNPLTTYARANRKAEEDIMPLGDSTFTVTVLRFATVYGYSKRMRFDLALNAMVLSLYKDGCIKVMREGTQWRPFLHVKDVCNAYKAIMDQANNTINREVYNVGSDDQNFQILPLAESVAQSLKIDCQIEWYGSPDFRSYQISFNKFKELADFVPSYTPKDGALEIYQALRSGETNGEIKTMTVEWYKHLIKSYNLVKEVSMRDTIF